MIDEVLVKQVRERFLLELRHHLSGWLIKVKGDLAQRAYEEELEALKTDPVYNAFGLASPEYVMIRLMGRLSISVGRRLGEIYDKIPRFIAQARFKLTSQEVAPKMGQRLGLDICIPLHQLSEEDKTHVLAVANKHFRTAELRAGLGIEIRYNFNPNDSARLRKDVNMAQLLEEAGLCAIYLIFSTNSPRQDAIARLERAGWIFLIGDKATEFMSDLIGMDFGSILSSQEVRSELEREMKVIMNSIYTSHSMKQVIELYSGKA